MKRELKVLEIVKREANEKNYCHLGLSISERERDESKKFIVLTDSHTLDDLFTVHTD